VCPEPDSVCMQAPSIQRMSEVLCRMAIGCFTHYSGYAPTERILEQGRKSNFWVLLWRCEGLSSSLL
jgi:hypothetical protein